MLELALFDRETLLREFGCSRRLAGRVGAWMGGHIAITAALLESAVPGSALEKLLLDKGLLAPADPAAALAALLESPEFSPLREEFGLSIVRQDEWAVIASAEDALASAGFAQIATPSAPAPAPAAAPLARPGVVPAAGDGEAFSAGETARLRIKIFTAPASAEKISALGQFAYAAVPTAEKTKVFLQALGDADAGLRAAAARGMRAFGAGADLAETLAAFAVRERLELTAERLRDLLPAASPAEQDAALMLLAGCVRDKNFAGADLAAALRALADAVAAGDSALAAAPDFLRILQERMLAEGTARDFRGVFAAVEKKHPGAASGHFLAELRQTGSDAYRALLFTLADGWELSPAARAEILPAAADTFAALPVEHPHSHTLRKFIFDGGDAGLTALAERLPGMSTAHQRAAVRLADNYLHSRPGGEVSAAVIRLAEVCRELLATAPLALRTDILETQVCLRADLPEAARADAARALLRRWTDYAEWPLVPAFENALVRLGAPAVAPLLQQLRAQKNHPRSAVFAAALGRIGVKMPADDPAVDRLAAEILREVVTMTFRESAIRDALHLAMGEIAARPGLPADANGLVRRTLMERLAQEPASAPLIQALGLACGGNLDHPEESRFILTFACQHLSREVDDVELTTSNRGGEEVFEVSAAVGEYSEVVPACLRALRHLACGARVPLAIREETTEKLLGYYAEPQKLAVRWGLANVTLLTEVLGDIGAAAPTRDRERVAIAVALSARAGSVGALRALAEIVALPNRLPQFDRLATALVERLRGKIIGEKTEEMREMYLHILTRALSRGRFAVRRGTVEELLEPAADLYLACLGQGLNGAWQQLDALHTAGVFPGAIGERVARELRRYTSLANK